MHPVLPAVNPTRVATLRPAAVPALSIELTYNYGYHNQVRVGREVIKQNARVTEGRGPRGQACWAHVDSAFEALVSTVPSDTALPGCKLPLQALGGVVRARAPRDQSLLRRQKQSDCPAEHARPP